MHRIFRPFRGLIVSFLFLGLPLSSFAADKKRTAAEDTKTKAKPTQKTERKQEAKTARDARNEKDRKQQQLAQKKNEAEKEKRGKLADKLAKQRHDTSDDKARGKGQEKTARREADKKKEQAKDKLAQHQAEKKTAKKDVAAKKAAPEKDAKSTKASTKAELAAAKENSKAGKSEPKKSEAKDNTKREPNNAKLLAKAETKAKSETKVEARAETKSDIKELPASKFTLRPIAKVVPKVELKFTVARALAAPVFDAPPPRDLGPDVIDVIEHDSPEARRLDELLRSEVKTLSFSSIPNVSHRKLDVGKMDAERIRQIQEVLAKKGYYAGEITGQYDDTTVEAMRKFQGANRIDVTGYATAQSLRLLGLTDW